MSSIITNNYRISAAQKFINSIEQKNNSLYVYLARINNWPDENNIPVPQDTVNEHVLSGTEILYLKKISRSNSSLAIKRYNWQKNYIYNMYRSDIDLFDTQLNAKPFYVFTEENNIYKCIFNNLDRPSKNKPTGKSSNIFSTGDGYLWKYMYSVTDDLSSFLIDEFIPVKNTKTVVDVDKGISSLYLSNKGTGYTTGNNNIILTGNGSGFSGYVSFKNGTAESVVITNKGVGYTEVSSVTLQNTTTGTSAVIIPVINPPLGHGSNPAQELGGNYVLQGASFFQNENSKISIKNDFRRIGILENPLSYKNPSVSATDEILSQIHKIKISNIVGATDYVPDETVTSTSGISAKVLEYDNVSFILYLAQVSGQFDVNDTITGATSGMSASVISSETGSIGSVVSASVNTIRFANTFTGTFDSSEFDILVKINSGKGINQTRIVKSYDVSTQTATLSKSWNIVPDSTSTYILSYYKLPDIYPQSGNILHISNIRTVIRDTYQNETILCCISF